MNVTVTLSAGAAGIASIALQNNGITIPGMTGAITITTVTTEVSK